MDEADRQATDPARGSRGDLRAAARPAAQAAADFEQTLAERRVKAEADFRERTAPTSSSCEPASST